MSKKKLTEKQIIDKLRIDEHYYGEFGRQWLSNSDIQNLSPNTFKQFGKVEPDNENFVKGRYFHQLILEPEKAKDFPIWSATETRGKAYKEFLKEKGLNFVLKESEALVIENMAKEIVSRHDQLTELITNKEALREEPFVGKIFGHDFKCKCDLISQQGIVVDLKTTSAKSIEEFIWLGKNKYYYDTQAFIYQSLTGKSMTFVAIDKQQKEYGNSGEFYHEIYVCPTSEETVLQGKQKVEQAIQTYEKYYGKDKKEDIRKVIYNLKF
tara:strand:- start:3315 stop:4115 length:801 start_codon:yes stop_codon:yes gene_type:complete